MNTFTPARAIFVHDSANEGRIGNRASRSDPSALLLFQGKSCGRAINGATEFTRFLSIVLLLSSRKGTRGTAALHWRVLRHRFTRLIMVRHDA